ncbi:S8 family serine peptidase [Solirubrobacter sp. CPCC 204708]|uniref:S8 family serine peptidase n=1 Tax=Solirubrobacter deserti TaxID=2282478 RepID=A0ABT4RKN9_9ACTN|nr:S8 family serine peptidase [Solirubrobacter deserti]MBE2316877.1 S8 family serine peptidase [Solirubrobacter deserti]MDA0138906.1 S8 family serine peptidase [Solirubrobacter deserti]
MRRGISATLGLVALLAVPTTAGAEEVIVKYKPGASKSALAERAGLSTVLGTVAANGAQVVAVADAKDAAAILNRSAAVEYAEPNVELKAFGVPNDARFGELYGLSNANDADMDAPEGWDLAGYPNLPAITVGIVDTGIDAAHEDLSGKVVACGRVQLLTNRVVEGSCNDDNDHGTHVAGTIAAKANNSVGVAGVSYNSNLAICKALNAVGSGTTAGVANCITYLAGKGVKIISMSLGGGASSTLQTAVRDASSRGSLIIAAAGNDGDATLNYPAAYPEVVSVAATDRNDARASFSNANADVEIAAAGVNVLSTKRGGGYVAFSGTSMATPHVAGVAALIAAKNPALTATQIRSKLQTSVDDKGAAGRDPQFGFGRVNLVKALS